MKWGIEYESELYLNCGVGSNVRLGGSEVEMSWCWSGRIILPQIIWTDLSRLQLELACSFFHSLSCIAFSTWTLLNLGLRTKFLLLLALLLPLTSLLHVLTPRHNPDHALRPL